jgi:hypothetical protein
MALPFLITSPSCNVGSMLVVPADQTLAQPDLASLVVRVTPKQSDAPIIRPRVVGMVGLLQIRDLVANANEEQAAIQRHDEASLVDDNLRRAAPP